VLACHPPSCGLLVIVRCRDGGIKCHNRLVKVRKGSLPLGEIVRTGRGIGEIEKQIFLVAAAEGVCVEI
jgi:hypothetical protein